MRNHIGKKIINSVLPVLLAFTIGGIIIAVLGSNPFEVYGVMIRKSLMEMKGITRTLQLAAPLLLTGIAISLCFKANIFNMGIEGQLIFGGFMAGIFGSYVTIPNPLLHILLCFAVGIACAMAFALIPAVLRAVYHVDEMVVTLVLNYAMAKVLEYLSTSVFRDAGSGYVCTPAVQNTAKFFLLGKTKMTAFVFVSFAVFLFVSFLMTKTKLGYSIEALGKNPDFAEATGLRSRRKVMTPA